MKIDKCVVYSIIIAFLVLNIIMVMYDIKNIKNKDQSNQEDYVSLGCNRPLLCNQQIDSSPLSNVSSDPIYHVVPSFAENRQCNFNTQEDVGQYSYAGCACERVGNQTNKVMMDDSILYKGFN